MHSKVCVFRIAMSDKHQTARSRHADISSIGASTDGVQLRHYIVVPRSGRIRGQVLAYVQSSPRAPLTVSQWIRGFLLQTARFQPRTAKQIAGELEESRDHALRRRVVFVSHESSSRVSMAPPYEPAAGRTN